MYDEQRRVYEEEVVDPVTPADPVAPTGYRREERVVVSDGVGSLTGRIIASRVSHTVWTIIGFIEALIAIRVVLKLIGANAANGFVNFIYNFSHFFVRPFLGIVNDPTSGKSILEINSLIAMLVYLLVGWVIVRVVWLIYDVSAPTRTVA
ncbi:MAG TPA: hypothetical protein VHV31_02780 [Nitrolancea sp.]|jgi:hypothetical protein|nr:hypothetical protein [Nitrolancea sp.]